MFSLLQNAAVCRVLHFGFVIVSRVFVVYVADDFMVKIGHTVSLLMDMPSVYNNIDSKIFL